ncbi:hypothetical protein C0J52_15899 [Blattella germanica]|nr:hypothetical protein C0J52_15899 [Blattella germanica]
MDAFMLYSLFIIYNFYSILGERTTANDPTANELNSNEPVCTSVRTGSVDDDGTMNSDDSTTRPETIMLYQCSSHATGHPSQMRRKSSLMDASNIGTEEWSNVEHSGSLSRTETLLNIQMLDSSSTSYDH